MRELLVPASIRRRAGQRRARLAREIAAEIVNMEGADFARLMFQLGRPLPAVGASEEYLQATGNTALTTTVATILGPMLSTEQMPLELAIAFVSNTTGVAAGASVTYDLFRNDTNAVFAAEVCTNTGAGAAAAGGATILAVVPSGIPAGNGVLFRGTASSGTATAAASATNPALLAFLGLA